MERARKKSYSSIFMIICVLVIITVCVGYLLIHDRQEKPHTKTPKIKLSISNVLLGVESKLITDSSLQKSEMPDPINTYGIPINGYSFNVQIPFNATMAVSYNDMNGEAMSTFEKLLPIVNRKFTQNGYAISASNQAGTGSGLLTIEYLNRSDSECQIVSYTKLDIYCDTANALRLIAAAAQPLVSSYERSYPPNGQISVQQPVVSTSRTPGYSIASMSVSGENGITILNFYKQATGPWETVDPVWYNDPHEDGSITPNCGYFDSLAATKLAFKGISCFDSASRDTSAVGE